MLRVGDRPLRLLRAVPGIELVELPDAESCRHRGRRPTVGLTPSPGDALSRRSAVVREAVLDCHT